MQTTRHRGGISYWIIFIFLMSFSTLSYSQKKKYDFLPGNNSRLRYTWGLPHFEEENTIHEVAKKFNFSYYRVGGCMMDPAFAEYCKKHNKKLDRKITKEFGADWNETFNQEFIRLYKLFRFADTLLMHDSSFWDQQVEAMVKNAGSEHSQIIGKDSAIVSILTGNDPPLIYFRETTKDSVLLVMICSTNKWVEATQLLVFKQFEFNLVTKQLLPVVINPEDRITTSRKK